MKTKILLPENIFSRILISEIKLSENYQLEKVPASLIAKKIASEENSIGFIPTMDLLAYKEFSISSDVGISFNALLSNAYIHFKEDQDTVDKIFLKGDFSSNEIILSKILFKEFYDIDVEPVLLKDYNSHVNDNLLIVGDENYKSELFLDGLSFAEEIIELLNAPYVNFVLAGSSEQLVKAFSNEYKDTFKNGHTEEYNDLLKELPQTSRDFISVNIQHVVFDLEEQDLEGIKSLLQMPYYHRIINDMIEVKFV